jgi:hypothetical protein
LVSGGTSVLHDVLLWGISPLCYSIRSIIKFFSMYITSIHVDSVVFYFILKSFTSFFFRLWSLGRNRADEMPTCEKDAGLFAQNFYLKLLMIQFIL